MKITYIIAFCLLALFVRAKEEASVPDEIIALPKYVVIGEDVAFYLNWHCRWPSQKTNVVTAWFTRVPPGGTVEKAGVRKDDRLRSLDGVPIRKFTGEGLRELLRKGWTPGETHDLIIERKGIKYSITIEIKKRPNQAPVPTATSVTRMALR